MKKFLMTILLFSLVLTGFITPKNASAATEENDARVGKVEITSIKTLATQKVEYIDYGQGYKYRVYSSNKGPTTFKGIAYDAQGNKVPAGTTFYIFFNGEINVGKIEIKCVVGENGEFEGKGSLTAAVGYYGVKVGKQFYHLYDIVKLDYYNEPERTNEINSNNVPNVYHFAH